MFTTFFSENLLSGSSSQVELLLCLSVHFMKFSRAQDIKGTLMFPYHGVGIPLRESHQRLHLFYQKRQRADNMC